ncbi:MAG: aldehyde dehydrogenase family protein, partial [Actinomycetota bacterium]
MSRIAVAFGVNVCDNGHMAAGNVVNVVNPFDQSVAGTVPRAEIADCLAAVDAAHDVFDSWRATAPRVRAEILRRAYELMIAEHDQLSRTIVRENGKVLADAKAEVTYAAEFFRWFSEEAVRIDGDYRRAPSGAN